MRRIVVALAVALVATAGVLARTLERPDPNVLAQADGCERNDATMQQGLSPNWVRVLDAGRPATGPAPPQRTATGIVNSNGLAWYSPHVSGGDTPYSHAAYDLDIDLRLTDPTDGDLLGTGNDATSGPESGEQGRLHTEREAQATPFFVWPEPGDRLTLRGYWVWDCDHFRRPGAQEVTGERTEIHPITVMWVERAWSPNSPTGESEGDLFLTTDKTEAGQQADCAHKTKHDQVAFKQCVGSEPNYVDMSGTYEFVLELPPRGRGRPRVRLADAGSVDAPPIRYRIEGRAVRIAFVVPKDGKRHVLAKRVFAGWTLRKPWAGHFRVSVETVLIRRSMDPGCLPQKAPPCGTPETTHEDQVSHGPRGEWNFYWDVGGIWSLWRPYVWRVRGGQTIRPKESVDIYVPRGRSFRVFVWPRECDWGSLALGRSRALFPCPKQPEEGNHAGDDVPGGSLATFRGAGTKTLVRQPGIGSCPRGANPRGCYAVTIRVRRLG